VRQAAIVAATIVVAGIFLAVVAATGTSMTVGALGLVTIAVVAAIAAVATSVTPRRGTETLADPFSR
jgi:hypothetical protein